MTAAEAINTVIGIAEEEIGYLEKKSNRQLDSKTANAGSGNSAKPLEGHCSIISGTAPGVQALSPGVSTKHLVWQWLKNS